MSTARLVNNRQITFPVYFYVGNRIWWTASMSFQTTIIAVEHVPCRLSALSAAK